MSNDGNWTADLRRYGLRRPLLKEQSPWAIWVYRTEFYKLLRHELDPALFKSSKE